MSFSTQALSCLLVVFAGASVALQQILNANLRAHLGSPWWAGAVRYLVGLLVMLAVVLIAPGPRLGAATTLALIVVGQMIGSLAFDHFGILGVAQQSATLGRMAGAACLILGVVLIRG